jgi:NTP pyrophosphatase (non-canonical NTP hydrolase)
MSAWEYDADLDTRSEIAALQDAVIVWNGRNFPGTTAELHVLGLCEESGELARAALKRAQGIRGTRDEWHAEIGKELGDVFIKLCCVAAAYGFDLRSAVVERWNDISRRDFVADPIGHGLPS